MEVGFLFFIFIFTWKKSIINTFLTKCNHTIFKIILIINVIWNMVALCFHCLLSSDLNLTNIRRRQNILKHDTDIEKLFCLFLNFVTEVCTKIIIWSLKNKLTPFSNTEFGKVSAIIKEIRSIYIYIIKEVDIFGSGFSAFFFYFFHCLFVYVFNLDYLFLYLIHVKIINKK